MPKNPILRQNFAAAIGFWSSMYFFFNLLLTGRRIHLSFDSKRPITANGAGEVLMMKEVYKTYV